MKVVKQTMHEAVRTTLEQYVGRNHVAVISHNHEYTGMTHWTRILSLLMSGRATPFLQRTTPRSISSPTVEVSLPLVAMTEHVLERKVIDPEGYAGKKAILARDEWTCKYCGAWGDTVDHIFPKSRGGQNTWVNLCAACKACNSLKDDYTLGDLGWSEPFLELNFVPEYRGNSQKIVRELNKVS